MDRLRIVVGFKVTPDYEALRAPDWARAADGAPESGSGAAAGPARPRPGTSAASSTSSTRPPWSSRCACGTRAARPASRRASRRSPWPAARPIPSFRRCRRSASTTSPGWTPAHVLDFAPRVTAAVIAAYLRRIGPPDVLLLGSRCGPGESGAVPFLVADELGLPCLTEVTEVQTASRGRLRVTFAAGGGQVRATIAPPCVLAVGNAVVSMLRVPTLKDRLAARERPLDLLSSGELGVDVDAALAAEPARLAGLETIDRERAGTIVAGRTPEEKARALYETHLRARLERL